MSSRKWSIYGWKAAAPFKLGINDLEGDDTQQRSMAKKVMAVVQCQGLHHGGMVPVDSAHRQQSRASVINREDDLHGRYHIGERLIIITSDHPYEKPTVKDEADALVNRFTLEQPERAGRVVVTA